MPESFDQAITTFLIYSVLSLLMSASRPFITAALVIWGSVINQAYTTNNLIIQAPTAEQREQALAAINSIRQFALPDLPAWMMSEYILMAVSIMALVEIAAYFDTNARELAEQGYVVAKPIANGALNLGLAQGQSAALLGMFVSIGQPGVALAGGGAVAAGGLAAVNPALAQVAPDLFGMGIAIIWAILGAVGTWLISMARIAALGFLELIDPGDSMGLQSTFALLETGSVVALFLILVFFPLVALGLFGATLLGMFLIQRWQEQRELKSRIPCTKCQTLMFPSAINCPNCREPNPAPRAVGVFGQPTQAVEQNAATQRMALLGRKRCPVCATRLKQAAMQQTCPSCKTVTFSDQVAVQAYLRHLSARLPITLLISFVLGLIPLLGIVLGVIYYRLSLIGHLRGYVPSTIGCATGWGLRIATLIMVSLQWIPFLGMLMVPGMCLLNFLVYRSILSGNGRKLPQSAPAEAAGMAVSAGGVAAMPAATSVMPPVLPAQNAPPPGASATILLPPESAPVAPATVVLSQAPEPAPSVQSPGTGKLCGSCGTSNLVNNRFCTACGNRLE